MVERSITSEPKITVRKNGSLRVEGDVALYDHEGNPLTIPTSKPYYTLPLRRIESEAVLRR